nr:predicted protein [Mycena chlorophos]
MQAGISGWNPTSSSSPALTSASTDSKFNFTAKGIEPTTSALQPKSNKLEEKDQKARAAPTQRPGLSAASLSPSARGSKPTLAKNDATSRPSTPADPAAQLKPAAPVASLLADAKHSAPMGPTGEKKAPATSSPPTQRATPSIQTPPNASPSGSTIEPTSRTKPRKQTPLSTAASTPVLQETAIQKPTEKTGRVETSKTPPISGPPIPTDVSRVASPSASGPKAGAANNAPQPRLGKAGDQTVRDSSHMIAPVATPKPDSSGRESNLAPAKPWTATARKQNRAPGSQPTGPGTAVAPTQDHKPGGAESQTQTATSAAGEQSPTAPTGSKTEWSNRKTVPATTPQANIPPNATTNAASRVAPAATASPDPSGVTVTPARESKPGPAPARPQADAQQAPSNPELLIAKGPVAAPQPNVRTETPAKPAEAPVGRGATPVSRVRQPHENSRETAVVAHEPKGTLSTAPKSGPGAIAARPDVSGDAEPNTGSGPGTATIHAAEPRDGGAHMRQSRKEVLGPVARVPTPTPTVRQPTPPLRQPTPPPRPSPAPTPAPAPKKDGFWRRVGKAVGLI